MPESKRPKRTKSKSRKPARRGSREKTGENTKRSNASSSRASGPMAAPSGGSESSRAPKKGFSSSSSILKEVGYVTQVHYDRQRNGFSGTVLEFPEVEAFGKTVGETQELLEAALEDALAEWRQAGKAVPKPVQGKKYPERLSVRISQGLYRRLDLLSIREKIELEKLVVELITTAIDKRGDEGASRSHKPSRPHSQQQSNQPSRNNQRHSRRPQGGGEKRRGSFNYRETMESRESFMDYVRKLEKGNHRK